MSNDILLTVFIAAINAVLKELQRMSDSLAALTTQVADNTTIVESAIALINGIAARITAAGTDPAALAALTQSLASEDTALAAAVAANTPAAPPPPVSAGGTTGG